MKYLLLILFFFLPFKAKTHSDVDRLSLVHVNAEWNKSNDIKIKYVKGIKIQFTSLEAQSESFKEKVKRVPILVLYKGNKAIYNWQADLSFKLDITEEEIKNIIEKALK